MSINFTAPESSLDLKPRIVVVGVGGAGGNAVNNMIRSNLDGVEFVVANTDSQALKHSQADQKIQLGTNVTQGLGAGARPEVGREAALESMQETMSYLEGANMVFITAGMGGGTGTGAAPVLAEACRDHGMLTVGVVTKPFHFEGAHRMRAADQGLEELQQFVDTLIVIPNQNLFRVANEKTTFADAFKMADDVLYSGVRGVTDLMVMPGLINLDFADIRTVMSEMGKAMMGTGEAEGENRAILAAESAISNPLLEDVSMQGARGVLINITGGADMTLFEVDEAANRIREEVDSDANIIFGSTYDESLEGVMRVSVVATGIDADTTHLSRPQPRSAIASLSPQKLDPVAEPASPHKEFDPYEDEPVLAGPRFAGIHEVDVSQPSEDPASHHVSSDSSDLLSEPAPEPVLFKDLDVTRDVSEGDPALESSSESLTHPLGQASIPTSVEPLGEAVPEAVRLKDAFIPPQPVRPSEMDHPSASLDPSTESVRDGESLKAQDEIRSAKSKPSLFSRMTSLGLGTRAEDPPSPQKEPSLASSQEAISMPSLATAPQPAISSAPVAAEVSGYSATAQAVRHVEADLVPTTAEEEMLEIPSFLRRQAN